jgi:translation initiation factor 2 alpha subunit (eIF-2alpha)
MYLNNKPSLHDIVFVQLGSSSDKTVGNYVQLVEYDDLEGLVLCTEITRYKSNLKSLVKRDEIFPVVVISTSNGYDLSYSKVKNNSRQLLKECYEFQNKIHILINNICNKINIDDNTKQNIIKHNLTPNTYEQSIIQNNNVCKELYESILQNSDVLFDKFVLINDDIKQSFKTQLHIQLERKPYNVYKEFKLLIVDTNSLQILKDILAKIKNIELDKKYNYDIGCRSSPYYYYNLTDNNLNEIEDKIKIVDNNITNICSEYKCECTINQDYVVIKKGEIMFRE